jgi:pimeloyl-ACP methyl ester carboxylesterase
MVPVPVSTLDTQSGAYKPSLVLLHGWGYDSTCWPKKMLQQLSANYDLILLDLPGHGEDNHSLDSSNSIEQLDGWIAMTKRQLPQQYHLMGWSLGAQIAIRMAHNDSCIRVLLLMAVNPKFITSDDWPAAMLPDLLMRFEQGYQLLANKTLRRFAHLQAQGSPSPKLLASKMIQLMPVQAGKILGLKLLQELDERTHLSQIQQPCYLELAEDDELVPRAWVNQLQLPSNVQVNYVSGGHGYLLEQEAIGTKMLEFLQLGCASDA